MSEIRVGLLLQLEASPGREEEVAALLRGALPLARREPGTVHWYAVRLGPSSFAVFDVFLDDAARDAHHHGPIAQLIMDAARAGLFADSPRVEKHEVLAAKTGADG